MGDLLLNSKWNALAMLSLVYVSGCCCLAIPLPGECQCPTDARSLYWSYGEEAVRRCPCGPDHQYYGLKPTCWREWPAGWHCNGCEGFPYVDRAACGDPVADAQTEPLVLANSSCDSSNPFRSNSCAAQAAKQLHGPDITPTIAPTSAKPRTAIVPELLPQPRATSPPAVETPLQKPSSVQPAPANSTALRKSVNRPSAVKLANVEFAATDTDEIKARNAPLEPLDASQPALMATDPAAQPIATAPILIAPLNAPQGPSAAKLEAESVSKPAEKFESVASETTSKVKADQPHKVPANDNDNVIPVSSRIEQHLLNNLKL